MSAAVLAKPLMSFSTDTEAELRPGRLFLCLSASELLFFCRLSGPLLPFQLWLATPCIAELHGSSRSAANVICDAAAEQLWVLWSRTQQVLALLCQESTPDCHTPIQTWLYCQAPTVHSASVELKECSQQKKQKENTTCSLLL